MEPTGAKTCWQQLKSQQGHFAGSKEGKNWTNDALTITISGPKELDLQLLDLPRLI